MTMLLTGPITNFYANTSDNLGGIESLANRAKNHEKKNKDQEAETNDSDCDGVPDALDQCPGGDDSVDTDNDGIPDCADWDGFDALKPEWKCGNNETKVVVCHVPQGNPDNANTLCVSPNAVPTHIADGDYLGPCMVVSCGGNGNDCCFSGVLTDNTLAGDGNPGNELSVNVSSDANNQLALGADGALFVAQDADADPTNELQSWSDLPGIPVDFQDGVDNVDDADNDPNNEKDADWFKAGATSLSNNINDNIYTNGKVGIGLNAPAASLHLVTDNSSNLLKVDGLQSNSIFVNKEGYVGIGTSNIPTFGDAILTVGFSSVFKNSIFHKKGFIYTEGGTGNSKGALGYRSSDNSYFLTSLGSDKIAFAIGFNSLPVAEMRAVQNEGKTFRVTTEEAQSSLPGQKDIANIELESSYYNGSSNRALSRLRNEVANTSTGDYQLDFEVGGQQRMSILSNGNVGIGITTPTAHLQVKGTNDSGFTTNFSLENGSGTPLVDVKNSGSVYIDGDVNIGVSTPDPQTKLDIDGNTLVRGILGVGQKANPGNNEFFRINGQYHPSKLGFVFRGASTSGYETIFQMDDEGTFIHQNSGIRNLSLGTNSQKILTIRDVGKVGINTQNAVTAFDVVGISPIDDVFSVKTGAGVESIYVEDGGKVGIGTTTPSEKLHVTGNVFADGGIFITSDKRFKEDIRPLDGALDKIKRLDGVSYRFRTEAFEKRGFPSGSQLGLIAQNLEEAYPELVKTYEDGYKAVNYDGLIPVLIEGIKEQQQQISQLENENNQIRREMDELRGMMQEFLANYEQPEKIENRTRVNLNGSQSIILDQNVPNPFKERTNIGYVVPADVKDAHIYIFGQTGKIMKKVRLQAGEGVLEVYASNLSSGMYSYSLVIDGQVMDTKKMVVNR